MFFPSESRLLFSHSRGRGKREKKKRDEKESIYMKHHIADSYQVKERGKKISIIFSALPDKEKGRPNAHCSLEFSLLHQAPKGKEKKTKKGSQKKAGQRFKNKVGGPGVGKGGKKKKKKEKSRARHISGTLQPASEPERKRKRRGRETTSRKPTGTPN